MSFTAMSVLIIFILCVTDALPRVFEKVALGKRKIMYFALCAGALSVFEINLSPELKLNISCLIILISCAAAVGRCEGSKTLALLQMIAFCAVPAALYNFSIGENEASMLVISFLTAAAGLISGGLTAAFACSASVPMLAEIFEFIAEMNDCGYGTLEFTENTVAAQLTGLIFCAVLFELYRAAKAFAAFVREKRIEKRIGQNR